MSVSFTAGQFAQRVAGELAGDPGVVITHLEVIDRAGPGSMTFVRDNAYAERLGGCRASAVLISRGLRVAAHPNVPAVITVENADLALIVALEMLAPPPAPKPPGVHPTALVDPAARVAPSAHVGPRCEVGPGAEVGDGTVLTSGVYVGSGARIGRGCTLFPNVVVLDRCIVGDGCILHAGVVIGADGFGYRPAPDGRGVVKIPHIGNVVLEPGVEIGANACVDRAKFGSTVIGAGSKIDNMVQVGHGCRIGRSVLIAAQVGLAGSVTIGDGAMLGGQVGVADQLSIGPMARLAGRAGVMENVPPGVSWGGTPARDSRDWIRENLYLAKATRESRPGGKKPPPKHDPGASS